MIKHLTLSLLATGFILAVTPVTASAGVLSTPAKTISSEILPDTGTAERRGRHLLRQRVSDNVQGGVRDNRSRNRLVLQPNQAGPGYVTPPNDTMYRHGRNGPPRQVDPGPAQPEYKEPDTGPQTQPPNPEYLRKPEPKSGPAMSGGRTAISSEF
jgi:hypothetical protein